MFVRLVTTPCVARQTWTAPIGIAQLAGTLREGGIDTHCLDLNAGTPLGDDPNSPTLPPSLLSACPESEGAETVLTEFGSILGDWTARTLDASPNIVGLSVLYRSQVVPALALATAIRRSAPKTTVVMGGNFALPSNEAMVRRLLLSGAVDIVVRGEGELTLLELAQGLGEDNWPADVCGIWYRHGNEVIATGARTESDLNRLPHACFNDFPLELYRDAWLGFPIHASRGCVKRCTFCNSRRYSRAFPPALPRAYRGRTSTRCRDVWGGPGSLYRQPRQRPPSRIQSDLPRNLARESRS